MTFARCNTGALKSGLQLEKKRYCVPKAWIPFYALHVYDSQSIETHPAAGARENSHAFKYVRILKKLPNFLAAR